MQILNNKYFKLIPRDCLNLSFEQSFGLLNDILSKEQLDSAFDITKKYPSPLRQYTDTNWCKSIKIIGVNPRLVGTYWGIIKYAMTFPEEAVHIMPLWETGDRGSLYVQSSWKLNSEFLDENLVKLGFDTPSKQLKLVVNLLHALGKTVGFDALPHVDNFSEIAILNPKNFEWVKLNRNKTRQLLPPEVDYNSIYKEVENAVIKNVNAPENLYELPESEKEKIIFPLNSDRLKRRLKIIEAIRNAGLEPLPVTEHSPCRPVVFDKIEGNEEKNWATFNVKNKSKAAKIIGCITPYKWYKIDNNGFPIKNAVEDDVWNYYFDKINNFQNEYNFDFLRADMSHNQLSHAHSKEKKDVENKLEMWAKLKSKIQETKPYFATFAEAFYSNYYINGIQDMINKNFDIVLGNMNFKFLNQEYVNCIDDYINVFKKNFPFNPCVCVFSNDGDLPEHSKYFQSSQANEIRFFTAIFLNLPSYMGMGYETKTLKPVKFEEFSNEYVKYQEKKYKFGENLTLFDSISQMRDLYVNYKPVIDKNEVLLLKTNSDCALAWIYLNKLNEPELLFVVNLDVNSENVNVSFDFIEKNYNAKLVYTNSEYNEIPENILISKETTIQNIFIGECAIYEIS